MTNQTETRQAKQLFDLLPNGCIHLVWEGYDMVLRQAKLGEYKAFKERVAEVQRQTADLQRDIAALQAQVASDATSAEQKAELLDQIQEINDSVSLSEAFGPLVREIIATLGGQEVDVDDMPPWLVENNEALNEMFTHWRRVPLARGGKRVTT